MLAPRSDDWQYGIYLTTALQKFWAGESITDRPTLVVDYLKTIVKDPTGEQAYGATENSPAYAAVWNANDALLVVHGTDLEAQYVPQFLGFVEKNPFRPDDSEATPRSTWCDDAAYVIVERLRGLGFIDAEHKWYAGHSAGAGISKNVAVLHSIEQGGFANSKYHLTTFGENATLNSARVGQLQGTDSTRWFTSRDPVPLLPWAILRLLGTAVILSPSNGRRILNFVHQGDGINLAADGGVQYADYPISASVDSTATLLEWVQTFQTGQQSEHWIAVYQARLEALLAAQFVLAGKANKNAVEELPPQLSLPTLNTHTLAQEYLRNLADELRTRQAADRLPPQQVQSLPTYYVKKNNGVWCIMRKGQFITTESGKRRAKSLARSWNRVLKANAGLSIPLP